MITEASPYIYCHIKIFVGGSYSSAEMHLVHSKVPAEWIPYFDWSEESLRRHHHHVVLVARISLTVSRHISLSFVASGRSSGLHPVSSHSCWMYVRAGRPAFARPCVGVHKSTSLMSSSLLLQQCPACLVRLTWIVFVIGGRWPYSWCLVGCCRQDSGKWALQLMIISLQPDFSWKYRGILYLLTNWMTTS